MRRISLDTPNEVLWAEDTNRDTERTMKEHPTPLKEATVVRTSNGNLVTPRAR